MAVAQKTGIPKWVALVSGNMDQNLRFAPPVLFEPDLHALSGRLSLAVLEWKSSLTGEHVRNCPPLAWMSKLKHWDG